jgi:hypothetical protein
MAEFADDSQQMPLEVPFAGDAPEVQQDPPSATVRKLQVVGFHFTR